jgi:hypothetical protein
MDDGEFDRISALPDELVHLILTFVAKATTVTSTAALSRRWRHAWVHARDLSFLNLDLAQGTRLRAIRGLGVSSARRSRHGIPSDRNVHASGRRRVGSQSQRVAALRHATRPRVPAHPRPDQGEGHRDWSHDRATQPREGDVHRAGSTGPWGPTPRGRGGEVRGADGSHARRRVVRRGRGARSRRLPVVLLPALAQAPRGSAPPLVLARRRAGAPLCASSCSASRRWRSSASAWRQTCGSWT